ncbi:hypothetical protein CAPTEDRAFT_101979 [Capitella teleta]|uniref:DNA helicase MCM8 n=1 Tax=Capitella teleta TaxID=283909 RepID=R7VJZ7_CAPTE|nr:hypothetical protein CAPTEDRAFT_101979 [Capitella teleta]|eukprot:ELU16340.1 hypothetical protein CAPTEDRAFT_101979 [Capitella teleta]
MNQTPTRGGGYRGQGRGSRGNWRGGRGSGYRGGNWRGNNGRGNWRGRGRGSQADSQNSSQSSQPPRPRTIQMTIPDVVSPYNGWTKYFPHEVYSDQSPTAKLLTIAQRYLNEHKSMYDLATIETSRSFSVDYQEAVADKEIIEGMPNFVEDVKNSPERILNCFGLAMHQMMHEELQRELAADSVPILTSICVPKVICRMTNHIPMTPLKILKANYYGKFVSIKGTVVRVSNIKPLCTQMTFECPKCSHIQIVALPEGKYVMPTSCQGDECRSRTFVPLRSHPSTETIDWQTIQIQEIINDSQRESGRIPRTVDCELSCDLVDSCVPGDIVALTGVVKVMNSDEGRGRQKDKCMFLLYIAANSITNAKGCHSDAEGRQAGLAIDFSMKELYAINEIHSEPNLFRLLVASLCPSICGHELVKAGLLLVLMGGTQKFANDKNRIPVRGDPHILVVGDPGLGKSQMLQAVANVAPRSVYVCGNTTTTSGLTVTLSRESGSDYALEAGALVLADQGCCCIDEFDKMTNQHQALLEAMEQQSISIAKAGIVCNLPARTSIVAAANPTGGHYNRAKTVAENIKMGGALLSRFDLVFILLDKPDEEMDSLLSEHVMAMHAGKKRPQHTPSLSTPHTQEELRARAQFDAEKSVSERLKVTKGQTIDPIPPQLVRKYIGYARKYVNPKMTSAAAKVIQEFYLNLRKKHQSADSTPITTRQLESLIRLSEARARLELREEVTENDAHDVVDIMKHSMIDTYSDEFGGLDFQRSQHGSGMSSRSQGKKFIAVLQRITSRTYNSHFTVQEMRQIAQDANIQIRDFENFVSSLNNQGYLLKKGPRVYQLQIADC